MKRIEYRIQYTGATERTRGNFRSDGSAGSAYETITVYARDINSGFAKALKHANEPLGNGLRREIGAIEFSQVLS
jgi:hypothetical protein